MAGVFRPATFAAAVACSSLVRLQSPTWKGWTRSRKFFFFFFFVRRAGSPTTAPEAGEEDGTVWCDQEYCRSFATATRRRTVAEQVATPVFDDVRAQSPSCCKPSARRSLGAGMTVWCLPAAGGSRLQARRGQALKNCGTKAAVTGNSVRFPRRIRLYRQGRARWRRCGGGYTRER